MPSDGPPRRTAWRNPVSRRSARASATGNACSGLGGYFARPRGHRAKWGERPLLVVVPKQSAAPTRDALLAFLEGKVARWWLPDDVVFVQEIPHTAAGKVEKKALRAMFRDRGLPEHRPS